MQRPTEEAEASISTENVVRESPTTNLNTSGTFAVRRTAAKRTLPWDLAAGELILASPPLSPQAEDIPSTKKPRLEEPLSASADEAASKISSNATAADDGDPVKGFPTKGHWKSGEDAKLITTVMNSSKKRWGQEYIIDWGAIAALVPGRGAGQCQHRWRHGLDPRIDRTPPDVQVDGQQMKIAR
jgi:hypothetical protein